MKKLRIGLATDWFLPETGGGETHILELAKWLTRQGHEVHILLGDRIYKKFKRSRMKLPFHFHNLRAPSGPFQDHTSFGKPISQAWAFLMESVILNGESIARLKLDILHAHSRLTMFQCIIFGQLLQIPSILTLHLNFLTAPSLWCQFFCAKGLKKRCPECSKVIHHVFKSKTERIWDVAAKGALAKNAGRILTLSSAGKKDLWRYQRLGENVTVMPNWVDLRRFRAPAKSKSLVKQLGLSRGDKVILFVGRIYFIKGIEYLIRAMPAIVKHVPNCKLVIAGRLETLYSAHAEYDASIKKLIQKMGVENQIIFAGNRTYQEMPELYALADVMVHPSLSETQGLALLEGMAARVPIVTTKLETIQEFMVDGKNGLLVKPRDSKAISQAVTRILEDPGLRKTLVRNGHQTVRQKFDLHKVLPRLMKVYREEIARMKPGKA